MASELLIRQIKLGRLSGQKRYPFDDCDIDKIIEALQAMEDLESLTAGKDDCSIVVGSINTKHGTVFAVDKGQGFCVAWFDSIPEALRAAAQAIQKGGE